MGGFDSFAFAVDLRYDLINERYDYLKCIALKHYLLRRLCVEPLTGHVVQSLDYMHVVGQKCVMVMFASSYHYRQREKTETGVCIDFALAV